MDDKRYRIVLKPETLSQLAEVQASITKMASVLQPSILHMVEDQRRLNEIIRTAVEPINAHLLSVSAALSASTAFQNQIVEMQKAEAAFAEIHSVGTRIAESMRAAAVVSFYKYDTLIQSIVESAYLYDLSRVADSIRSVSENLYRFFEPATTAYRAWRESLAPAISIDIKAIMLLLMPVREQFLTTDFLGSLQETPIYEGDAVIVRGGIVEEVEEHLLLSLPEALSQLNPSLYRLWRGAWDSLTSSNPDKIRHTLTSARELVTYVLHELSPDEQILGWSTLPEHYDKGRPTRRARLLFIASHVESDVLHDYLLKEIEACLSLIQVFQVGTHGIAPSFSDSQLKVILRKVHSMICTLVEMRNDKG
ncbi:MAG: hypothetical protein C4554_05615 [Dethiobacter sp.]|jgi:hypothetical protein|nr:MAG: hypothetical protein C4554_05615 [Dethiobacter sp.]